MQGWVKSCMGPGPVVLVRYIAPNDLALEETADLVTGGYNDPELCAICGVDYYDLFKKNCLTSYAVGRR